ncbi:unnamed protein product, partial [Prorocentrum cordatum]
VLDCAIGESKGVLDNSASWGALVDRWETETEDQPADSVKCPAFIPESPKFLKGHLLPAAKRRKGRVIFRARVEDYVRHAVNAKPGRKGEGRDAVDVGFNCGKGPAPQ